MSYLDKLITGNYAAYEINQTTPTPKNLATGRSNENYSGEYNMNA